MKPIVNGLEEEFEERIAFSRLDANNDGRDAFAAFKLRGHASYVIIDSMGDVLWRSVGEQQASGLEDAIRRALDGN